MKLNKAEKFVKRQFEMGKTRNQVREAIFEKLGNWNFPPEYENALATQDPLYDDDRDYLMGTDYGKESYTVEQRLEELAAQIPTPGSSEWESWVDKARVDIARFEEQQQAINIAKRILKSKGLDFDEEFAKWKEKRNDPKR